MQMLNVSDLFVSYGQSQALHGITFSANRNETVAVMGRNGMGKTTLFRSLIGVLPLESGRVEVDGADVSKDESYRRVAKGIGYVPQGRMVFPTLTVEENIKTGMENAKNKIVPEDIYALFPVLFEMRRRTASWAAAAISNPEKTSASHCGARTTRFTWRPAPLPDCWLPGRNIRFGFESPE